MACFNWLALFTWRNRIGHSWVSSRFSQERIPSHRCKVWEQISSTLHCCRLIILLLYRQPVFGTDFVPFPVTVFATLFVTVHVAVSWLGGLGSLCNLPFVFTYHVKKKQDDLYLYSLFVSTSHNYCSCPSFIYGFNILSFFGWGKIVRVKNSSAENYTGFGL
jgi:hypothetical protein